MGDIINAGADLLGFGPASKQAKATTQAANISAESMREALALQERMYREGISRQQPFLDIGTNALNRLVALNQPGANTAQFIQQDPGYAFRLSEGQKALDRSAAARGGLISGGAMKAAQRYGQEMGSQEFGNAYNRMAGLAQLGPSAAGIQNTLGTNYANQANQLGMINSANQGNLALQRGNIAATQYGNYSNVLGNALAKYNFGGGGGGNTYTGAGQVNPSSGEYMGSLEF
jgi:hypothetical protein